AVPGDRRSHGAASSSSAGSVALAVIWPFRGVALGCGPGVAARRRSSRKVGVSAAGADVPRVTAGTAAPDPDGGRGGPRWRAGGGGGRGCGAGGGEVGSWAGGGGLPATGEGEDVTCHLRGIGEGSPPEDDVGLGPAMSVVLVPAAAGLSWGIAPSGGGGIGNGVQGVRASATSCGVW